MKKSIATAAHTKHAPSFAFFSVYTHTRKCVHIHACPCRHARTPSHVYALVSFSFLVLVYFRNQCILYFFQPISMPMLLSIKTLFSLFNTFDVCNPHGIYIYTMYVFGMRVYPFGKQSTNIFVRSYGITNSRTVSK